MHKKENSTMPEQTDKEQINILVIGVGNVGSHTARELAAWRDRLGVEAEITLINRHHGKAAGVANDINVSRSLWGATAVKTVPIWQPGAAGSDHYVMDEAQLKILLDNHDIVVLAHGLNTRTAGVKDRQGLAEANYPMMEELAKLAVDSPATFLVATNPCDDMTRAFYQEWVEAVEREGSDIDDLSHRVVGIGTNLDAIRLQFFLGQLFQCHPDEVQVGMIGLHSQHEMIGIPDMVFIKGEPLREAIHTLDLGPWDVRDGHVISDHPLIQGDVYYQTALKHAHTIATDYRLSDDEALYNTKETLVSAAFEKARQEGMKAITLMGQAAGSSTAHAIVDMVDVLARGREEKIVYGTTIVPESWQDMLELDNAHGLMAGLPLVVSPNGGFRALYPQEMLGESASTGIHRVTHQAISRIFEEAAKRQADLLSCMDGEDGRPEKCSGHSHNATVA